MFNELLKRIILIGCGNIGSRHLQGLMKLQHSVIIEIVEPNIQAQLLAKSRLEEIKKDNTKHELIWHKSISELKDKSDLVIIATNAKNRVNLIEKTLKLGHKRFLVEKIVCQSNQEYEKLLLLMKKFNAKGWVNTNRKYFKSYQKINRDFKNSKYIHMSVFSEGSVLGTNAIHYLDLFCWLAKENQIKLDGEFLSKKLLKNKRSDKFIEFSGNINGFTKNGSCISLKFSDYGNELHQVKIYNGEKVTSINELKEEAYSVNRNGMKNFKFKFEHVSSLTTKIVNDILINDDCLLSSLQDSYQIHKELFRIFNQHLKKILKRKLRLCPIT